MHVQQKYEIALGNVKSYKNWILAAIIDVLLSRPTDWSTVVGNVTGIMYLSTTTAQIIGWLLGYAKAGQIPHDKYIQRIKYKCFKMKGKC